MVKKEPLDELGLIQVLPATSYAPLGKASGPSKPVSLVSRVKDKSDGLHFKELSFKTTCFKSIYLIAWDKRKHCCHPYLLRHVVTTIFTSQRPILLLYF